MELLEVSLASLLAGFVDSLVGGGGLVLRPAPFTVVPTLGYHFLNASASAKPINTATKLAALLMFAGQGHVRRHIALALANVPGCLLGTRLAQQHGAGFTRLVFIGLVTALILENRFRRIPEARAWPA